VPLTYIVFHFLQVDGEDVTHEPFRERRLRLEQLELHGTAWTTSPSFEDGNALWSAVCQRGLEGVVAKKLTSRYLRGQRGWVKVENPRYWRRDAEREAVARSRSARLKELS
jgi:bifunctional non-homologous end joining protein LigD